LIFGTIMKSCFDSLRGGFDVASAAAQAAPKSAALIALRDGTEKIGAPQAAAGSRAHSAPLRADVLGQTDRDVDCHDRRRFRRRQHLSKTRYNPHTHLIAVGSDHRLRRGRHPGAREHVFRTPTMIRRRPLTLAQQYVNLRANPASAGTGGLRGGRLLWLFETSPHPLSRTYQVRIEMGRHNSPEVYVESPDLHLLVAEGSRLPHVYEQDPPRLCLFLPGTGEFRPWMRLDQTIVPWAALWLFYFEDWLVTDEWKGGGKHPGANRRRILRMAGRDHRELGLRL
jgi:hypothetical protein